MILLINLIHLLNLYKNSYNKRNISHCLNLKILLISFTLIKKDALKNIADFI